MSIRKLDAGRKWRLGGVSSLEVFSGMEYLGGYKRLPAPCSGEKHSRPQLTILPRRARLSPSGYCTAFSP
jgi:hypothetical protein